MLSAITALAAASALAQQPVPGREAAEQPTARYVADFTPTKAVNLLDKDVCESSGAVREQYVIPTRLVVQLMVQLEMFDALRTKSAAEALLEFDGRHCPETNAGMPHLSKEKAAYCSGSIIVQRLLLNVYPGYRPTETLLDDAYVTDLGPEQRRAVNAALLKPDVAELAADQRKRVRDLALRFLTSEAGTRLVECDFAAKVKLADGETPAEAPATLARNGWADAAEFGHQGARLLRVLQFRQFAGNLAYRGASDSYDKAHPTYTAGQDLYATDAGVSFSLGQEVGSETDPARGRTYSYSFAGVVGVPLCGLVGLAGNDCTSTPPGSVDRLTGKTATPSLYYNFIPYYGFDRSFKKSTPLGPTATADRKHPTDQEEIGLVTYLATDDKTYECAARKVLGRWGQNVESCGSYYVARVFNLKNDTDDSELRGVALRYTPIFKTRQLGLDSFDICLNTVCGDPNRVLRLGALLDARINLGWFEDRGTNAAQQAFNQDYTRIGGRVGVLGVFNPTPDNSITFWAAYTDFEPLKGFDRDLGEIQTQVNFTFSAATLAFTWRNGRREDTAKRDSTYKVTLGFKTK